MSEQHKGPQPTEINLHRKSGLLNIRFSDGQSFSLPCEYLRVNSKAAEVTSRKIPEIGKEHVNIDRIDPQGTYAVRIVFDDGPTHRHRPSHRKDTPTTGRRSFLAER